MKKKLALDSDDAEIVGSKRINSFTLQKTIMKGVNKMKQGVLLGTRKRNSVLMAVMMMFFLISVLWGASDSAFATSTLNEIILRFNGSNTIGAKLLPALATEFLKTKLGASEVTVTPLGANEVRIDGVFSGKTMSVLIHAHGSATGFKGLKDFTCDIAMSSRRIKPEEAEALSFLGDMMSFACEYVLGLDGIAVIVNEANPITKLSIKQIADIFSGKITDWAQIDKSFAGPISVYARDDKSGTYDTFKHLVLDKASLTPNAKRYESNAELSKAVSSDTYAIGFTGLPYVLRSKALAISDGDSPAIYPTPYSVATEDYPLSRRLYLYTPMYPDNIYTRFFIDFALSKEGQDIVQKIEFVDQNIKIFEHTVEPPQFIQNRRVFDEYAAVVRDLKRVSINFQFESGRLELDNKSMQNLQRFVSFLRQHDSHQQRIITLAGFADSVGDYTVNYNIALGRAQSVAKALMQRGIGNTIQVISAGEESPIASNATITGREKNRRVELWIK